MFSDHSSSRVYGLSHFGTQVFPHLFLNMTKTFKRLSLNLSQGCWPYILSTFLPSLLKLSNSLCVLALAGFSPFLQVSSMRRSNLKLLAEPHSVW